MKILITGGAGFIGSHLVERLSKKNEVVILDNFSTGRKKNLENIKGITIIECDISKKGNWEKNFKNVKCVFHLAALADVVPSIDFPNDYYNSNVTGTFNVMQACRKYKIKKLIYSASSSCYGIPKKYPTTETEKIDTQYPYALTKYLGEQICLHWGKLYSINVISLRLFNVYGTRSRTSGTYGAMFGVFLAQKLANKPYTVIGDGKQTRDFTYVTDVVSAMVFASKSNIKNEIFNIGSGKTISVNSIVKILGGKKVFIPKRPGEPDCTFADTKKIKKLLGWKSKVDIHAGIKKILNEIDYWKEAPVWTPKKIKVATRDWFKYIK
jgi:UDP-glucose 4-epimerase